MKKTSILFAVLISTSAWAQFEEEGEAGAGASPRLEVSQEDLKALADARANKSEEGLIRAASKILGVDSKNVMALNALGVFYFEQGKLGLARLIFNRALVDHAEAPALHNNLGIVFLAEGKQRQALASFRKALELKSNYQLAAANLGSIFVEYRDFQRALSPLEAGYKATKSELKSGAPHAVEVANNYAIALTGLGRFDDARDIYRTILEGSGRNPAVLLNYAILLVEKMKDYKEANKIISRVKFAVEDDQVLKRIADLEAKMNQANQEN